VEKIITNKNNNYKPKLIMKLKYIIPVTLAIILAGSSCKSSVRKDLSLNINEYQVQGLPDITKPWTEEQLMKAHVALGNVRMKNFQALPRKGSKRSGAIFKQYLNPDNLSFVNDTTSLHDKAFRIQAFWSFINDIGLMYTDNFRTEQYYNEELIDIYGFQLYTREKMFELADRIDKSSDPLDAGMRQGRVSIVIGYVNLVEFMIKQQEKTRSFTTKQLKNLDKEIIRSISENVKYLDNESKQKLSSEIKQISEKSASGFVKKDFNVLLKILM
jgi:hypothetical protein